MSMTMITAGIKLARKKENKSLKRNQDNDFLHFSQSCNFIKCYFCNFCKNVKKFQILPKYLFFNFHFFEKNSYFHKY